MANYFDSQNGISGSKYDAARVVLGNDWRMPTLGELQELLESCSVDYLSGGVRYSGNGNSIFVPASAEGVTYFYQIRTASLVDGAANSSRAWVLNGIIERSESDCYRYEGIPIRAVTDNPNLGVDLGLSVRWAPCNLGAETETEVGNYYSFAELETKESYTESNYTVCPDGNYGTMSDKLFAEEYEEYISPIPGELKDIVTFPRLAQYHEKVKQALREQGGGMTPAQAQDLANVKHDMYDEGGKVATLEQEVGNLQSGKQDKLIAGANISIVDNVISAVGGGSGGGNLYPSRGQQTDGAPTNKLLDDELKGVDVKLFNIIGHDGELVSDLRKGIYLKTAVVGSKITTGTSSGRNTNYAILPFGDYGTLQINNTYPYSANSPVVAIVDNSDVVLYSISTASVVSNFTLNLADYKGAYAIYATCNANGVSLSMTMDLPSPLDSRFANIKEVQSIETFLHGKLTIDDFANGSISSSGYVASTKYRICTPLLMYADMPFIVNTDVNFRTNLLKYTSDGVQISSEGNKGGDRLEIGADTYYRLVVRRNTENTSETADIAEFFDALSFDGNYSFLERTNHTIKDLKALYNRSSSFHSVAHQGYTTNGVFGRNIAINYANASAEGFTDGECDIRFTADGVAVCCHDASFVDENTGNTIVIAEHSLSELKSYKYYGTTIATFEEVLATCKAHGIGLWIDRTSEMTASDDCFNHIFGLVKMYAMIDDVFWITTGTAITNKILSVYPQAKIVYMKALSDDVISYVNSIKSDFNTIILSVDYSSANVSAVKSAYQQLKVGISMHVYTIDDYATYMSYLPYVCGITSNKISRTL